jgi:carboxymethylenebutenolidase
MTSPPDPAGEKVELAVADGTRMAAYTVRSRAPGPHPGVIVLQEAFGVNSHIRSVADRLAQAGFAVVAPELFHRTAPGFEGSYKDFPSVRPHIRAVTPSTAEIDLRASFEWLRSHPQVKAEEIYSVGFCLGGKVSFLANALLPLRAAVSFYGGGIAPDLLDRAQALGAPMLFFWGGLDQRITAEHREAVTEALDTQRKTYVNVVFSDADHGFFCDERASYQPRAARQAWSLMLEFLRSW